MKLYERGLAGRVVLQELAHQDGSAGLDLEQPRGAEIRAHRADADLDAPERHAEQDAEQLGHVQAARMPVDAADSRGNVVGGVGGAVPDRVEQRFGAERHHLFHEQHLVVIRAQAVQHDGRGRHNPVQQFANGHPAERGRDRDQVGHRHVRHGTGDPSRAGVGDDAVAAEDPDEVIAGLGRQRPAGRVLQILEHLVVPRLPRREAHHLVVTAQSGADDELRGFRGHQSITTPEGFAAISEWRDVGHMRLTGAPRADSCLMTEM